MPHGNEETHHLLDMMLTIVGFLAHFEHHKQRVGMLFLEPRVLRIELIAKQQCDTPKRALLELAQLF